MLSPRLVSLDSMTRHISLPFNPLCLIEGKSSIPDQRRRRLWSATASGVLLGTRSQMSCLLASAESCGMKDNTLPGCSLTEHPHWFLHICFEKPSHNHVFQVFWYILSIFYDDICYFRLNSRLQWHHAFPGSKLDVLNDQETKSICYHSM